MEPSIVAINDLVDGKFDKKDNDSLFPKDRFHQILLIVVMDLKKPSSEDLDIELVYFIQIAYFDLMFMEMRQLQEVAVVYIDMLRTK